MTKKTEAPILAACKAEAKRLGLTVIRMSFMPGAASGWPDLLVLGPNGNALFIETKRPGEKLRPLQEERFRQLQALQIHCAKIDSVEEAHTTILRFGAMCQGLL